MKPKDIWIAKDGNGSIYLYSRKPEWDEETGEFLPENAIGGDHALKLTPGQAADFGWIKPGECVPVWWWGFDEPHGSDVVEEGREGE